MFLDLNFTKLLVLGVIALIVFGPERLPALAAQAGRALRELRRMAEGAKSELKENLGPEFSNLDIADLNPRHFVRKHIVDELTGDGVLLGAVAGTGAADGGAVNGAGTPMPEQPHMAALSPGERPPYDAEAT
ncbi:MAG TPA: sec-independent translocase [Streptosporangiaceae bacterium]|nr:sec-independent translocase [Streptosporangiaceae bacterium]